MPRRETSELGPLRALIARIGEVIIYGLIRIFGRRVACEDAPWLIGPLGGDYIGDTPYEEWAAREGLEVERAASQGGLLQDFGVLGSDHFDPGRVHALVREFYEHTARFRMDVWAESYFPANIGLWLLVTTISRKVNQLNFPLRVLETAKGMDSEIVLLRREDGAIPFVGWYRRLRDSGRVIYTGFYMTETPPRYGCPCVKVVFPMPGGNATVILRPEAKADGSFELISDGRRFGDVGFYRIQAIDDETLRVWFTRSLKEKFHLYVDPDGALRCDHRIRFLGLPVVHLHFRMERVPG